jgi:lysophospholipase L1-like esterase
MHAWSRYVAIGDSFTEGIGDPEPDAIGGHRGWADRVAEVLAMQVDDFRYANLAVRGKLLDQIAADQAELAASLGPDLVTISAGGNDILRPGSDPDELARRLDRLVGRMAATGATVVLFTGPDVGVTPVMRAIRGKVAIYDMNIHKIAQRHGAIVADLWAISGAFRDPRMWAEDRLHYSPLGHQMIARLVLAVLGVEHSLDPSHPEPLPQKTWRRARAEDLAWARTHFVPWVGRRMTGRSSGDGILPKRPDLGPL